MSICARERGTQQQRNGMGSSDGAYVGRDLVPTHPMLHFLDRLVQAQALLLHDRVHEHLVRDRRAHRAARAQALGEVVAELRTERVA